MTEAKADIPKTDDRSTRWSLFLGITIWFVDLNSVYALPSVACMWNWFPFSVAGIPGLVFVEAIISLVSLTLILIMIYLPYRNWRRRRIAKSSNVAPILQEAEQDRHSLLALVSMLANSFFLLFVIANFVPMLALNACARG